MRQARSPKLNRSHQVASEAPSASSHGMDGRRATLVVVEPVLAEHPHRQAADVSSTPFWEPIPRSPGRIPTPSEVLNVQRSERPQNLPSEIETAILATLTRPLTDGEGHQSGNSARERELREIFADLDVWQSYQLARRLDAMRADDALAQAFMRLIPERRHKLRAFLADAKRRQAVMRARA